MAACRQLNLFIVAYLGQWLIQHRAVSLRTHSFLVLRVMKLTDKCITVAYSTSRRIARKCCIMIGLSHEMQTFIRRASYTATVLDLHIGIRLYQLNHNCIIRSSRVVTLSQSVTNSGTNTIINRLLRCHHHYHHHTTRLTWSKRTALQKHVKQCDVCCQLSE